MVVSYLCRLGWVVCSWCIVCMKDDWLKVVDVVELEDVVSVTKIEKIWW